MSQPANNKLYFKAFNEDYRVGGVYHSLDTSELCCMIKLQSYCGSMGMVYRTDGVGYNFKELSEMMGLNYRTTKRTLLTLSAKGLIQVDTDMVITLVGFLDDQTERDTSNSAKLALNKVRAIERARHSKDIQDLATEKLLGAANKASSAIRELSSKIEGTPKLTESEITELARAENMKTNEGVEIIVKRIKATIKG